MGTLFVINPIIIFVYHVMSITPHPGLVSHSHGYIRTNNLQFCLPSSLTASPIPNFWTFDSTMAQFQRWLALFGAIILNDITLITASAPRPYHYGGLLLRSVNGSDACSLDRTQPPGDLTNCGNNTLFSTWRPKARFIAPEGWMNDPMGLFQRNDGIVHAGYQCNPNHINWGNISQCSAFSSDLVYWSDANSTEGAKTIWPSQLYDIRGVFDGTVIHNGWEGYPTILYTSTYTTSLGATASPPEQQGAETQSLAYTTDGGNSWIKLNFGPQGNPVIYEWPLENLTGFRDPYVFTSPLLENLLSNTTTQTNATGPLFVTISSGIRTDADPSGGPRLLLYRQTTKNEFRDWTYLGPLVSVPAQASFSEWSGNYGINFETASVSRLNETGRAFDDGSDTTAINIIGMGTEQGRNGSHEDHWPIWLQAEYTTTANGSVVATPIAAGVFDWGRVYAVIDFVYNRSRAVSVGWVYEDDESLILTKQRGYQGAFTLFRDLFAKVIRNVDPSTPGLNETGSWTVRQEADGSLSVVTLGQKVIPEILSKYKLKSHVTSFDSQTFNASAGIVPLETQPTGSYYAVTGTFSLEGATSDLPSVGFRVQSSSQEWTDVYFNPANETLIIDRSHSSLITSYGSDPELGKLRLWNITTPMGSQRQDLNMSIFVDGSIIEVYANDVLAVTTRAYPWLSTSTNVGFLVQNGTSGVSFVNVSNVELWDGLLDAWPRRPNDTAEALVWDGPAMAEAYGGLWDGI